MKALCLVCVALLISGCSGPSYCERRLVPINGLGATRTGAPLGRRVEHGVNSRIVRQGQRP